MKKLIGILGVLGFSFYLVGCGGTQVSTTPKQTVQATQIEMPWDKFCNKYAYLEGGLTACECVFAEDLEDADYARDEAIANARTKLAQQLNVKVAALTKTHKIRTKAGKKRYTASNFEEVAKQLAKAYLQGARPIKYATFKTPDGKYKVCVVVALQPQVVKDFIHSLVQKTGLNPKDEELLYEQFKAYKAQQELEKELQKENQ